ncbi:MAG: META domain-containing protein, partial [Alphaproteobacteria bacterium]
MRRLSLAALLAVTTTAACAVEPDPVGVDWQLLAVDGAVVDHAATLRIEADGTLGGKAPCNSWSSQNGAALPDLALRGIRATRMACDRLAEEQAFFAVLEVMTRAEMDEDSHLILTGPEGRVLEFVRDRSAGETCKTCRARD